MAKLTEIIRGFVADTVLSMQRASPDVRVFRLPIEPVPASRPKWSKYGVHYSKAYQGFRQLGQPIANAYDAAEFIPRDVPVVILVEHVMTKARTSRKFFPPRADVDNLVKGPLDLMVKAEKFFHDDQQIVALTTVKRFTEPDEEACINIFWYPVEFDK